MTDALYGDAYRRTAPAEVVAHTEEGGIVLSESLFYPTGGGQPGDSGWLVLGAARIEIATTVRAADRSIVLVPAAEAPLPPIGSAGTQEIDWARRARHMRVHTALHLLSVVLPLPVTGGQISSEKGRLDFDMEAPPEDKEQLAADLQALIDRDLPVSERWITDAELMANPGLVKTMSVRPPTGQGRVRLVQIGAGPEPVDLQPCGGTHVARTGEIGKIAIGKIEKKGARNRRVNVLLVD